jgi:hypothetical protein
VPEVVASWEGLELGHVERKCRAIIAQKVQREEVRAKSMLESEWMKLVIKSSNACTCVQIYT